MAESIQKEDWERFRALGEVPSNIREVVLQSWRRTASKRDIPSLKRAPKVSQGEFETLRGQSSALRSSARSVVQRSSEMLSESGSIFLLCNTDGIILDAAGDRAVLESASENHLHIGGRWDEGAIGTNAIGTALHTKRPVEISGVEHFCEEIQRWSCAATPVIHPANGSLLGVVDISGQATGGQRHHALLSAAFASQITESLQLTHEQDQRRLMEYLLSVRRHINAEGLLLLDKFGGEVFSSQDFTQQIAKPEELDTIRAQARMLDYTQPDDILETFSRLVPGADIEIIEDAGDPLGLMIVLPSRMRRRRIQCDPALDLDWIKGSSPEMEHLCESAERLARGPLSLMIEGETGVGKEVLARAIHMTARPKEDFELIYCGGLKAEKIRHELTGEGRITSLLRAGGTLCLDEPSAATSEVQMLLFQLLSAEGISQPDEMPGRVISLTTGDLFTDCHKGLLRTDLCYALCGARLKVPPLRERKKDIPHLIQYFCGEASKKNRQQTGGRRLPLRFTPAARTLLEAFDWPGNIRQLRNLIEQFAVLSPNGLVDTKDLPPEFTLYHSDDGMDATLRNCEKTRILDAINETGGNMTATAQKLGIARSTLYLKLDAYQIPRPVKS